MHRRTQRILGGMVVALVIGPADAAAQNIDSPYRFLDTRQEVGVFGGYLTTGRGTLELGPRSAALFGARYSIAVSGPLALEGDLSFFSSTRAVQDTLPGDTAWTAIGDADFRAVSVLLGLRFNVTGARTWHGLMPFLVFAGGFTTEFAGATEPDASLPADVQYDFGTSFTGALGAGLEWLPTSGIGIRFDARSLLWKLKTPTPFLRGEQALVVPGDEWAQNYAFTAGIVLRF